MPNAAVTDEQGLKLLDDMERSDEHWEVTLQRSGLDRYAFADWISASAQRREKFAEIRRHKDGT